MNWIARLSMRQVISVAFIWLVVVMSIPILVLAIAKAHADWVAWRSHDTATYFLRLRIVSWPWVAWFVLLPPLAFLIVWWVVRRTR